RLLAEQRLALYHAGGDAGRGEVEPRAVGEDEVGERPLRLAAPRQRRGEVDGRQLLAGACRGLAHVGAVLVRRPLDGGVDAGGADDHERHLGGCGTGEGEEERVHRGLPGRTSRWWAVSGAV